MEKLSFNSAPYELQANQHRPSSPAGMLEVRNLLVFFVLVVLGYRTLWNVMYTSKDFKNFFRSNLEEMSATFLIKQSKDIRWKSQSCVRKGNWKSDLDGQGFLHSFANVSQRSVA